MPILTLQRARSGSRGVDADIRRWCNVLLEIKLMKNGQVDCDDIYKDDTVHSMVSHWWLTSPMEKSVHMSSKVSYDWRPSYIKASQPALDIFQMARYTQDWTCIVTECTSNQKNQIILYWLGVGWFKWNQGDFNSIVWNPECNWLSLFNLLI